MSLGIALTTALSGLQAQQRKSAILARNVANATTPGFTRKEAVLASLTVAGEGRGVAVVDVRRAADAALAREVRTQSARQAALQARADALATHVQTVGQPNEERSLSSAMAALERAFLKLEELPESPTQQQAVVDSAIALTERLTLAERSVRQVRQQADADIAGAVTQVNQSLRQLEGINRQLAIRTGSGQDVTELEDERDRLLDFVSENIGIHYFLRQAGEVVVMTSGGTTLLDGTARDIQFTGRSVIGAGNAYPADLSGLTVEGSDITPGNGQPNAVKSGRLAGLFDVRDRSMTQVQGQLDEIASTLIDRFQAADATAAPGQPGLFTDAGAAHDRPAGRIGLAGRIAVNDRVRLEAGGDPTRVRTGLYPTGTLDVGDTSQLRAFIGVFSRQTDFDPAAGLMPRGTLSAFTSASVGAQHAMRASAEKDSAAQSVLLDTVRMTREGREGVNIDDELQELMLVEKGYAAASQVIQAASRMLDRLLEIQ